MGGVSGETTTTAGGRRSRQQGQGLPRRARAALVRCRQPPATRGSPAAPPRRGLRTCDDASGGRGAQRRNVTLLGAGHFAGDAAAVARLAGMGGGVAGRPAWRAVGHLPEPRGSRRQARSRGGVSKGGHPLHALARPDWDQRSACPEQAHAARRGVATRHGRADGMRCCAKTGLPGLASVLRAQRRVPGRRLPPGCRERKLGPCCSAHHPRLSAQPVNVHSDHNVGRNMVLMIGGAAPLPRQSGAELRHGGLPADQRAGPDTENFDWPAGGNSVISLPGRAGWWPTAAAAAGIW